MLWASIGTNVLAIIKMFYDGWQRDRDRHWDLEDKRLMAQQTAEHRQKMQSELGANTQKTDEIHQLANSQLTEQTTAVRLANQEIGVLRQEVLNLSKMVGKPGPAQVEVVNSEPVPVTVKKS